MAEAKSLIRNLNDFEKLGDITTICCDKTGALTSGKMSVVDAYIAGRHYHESAILDPANGMTKVLHKEIMEIVSESLCLNSCLSSMVVTVSYFFPTLPTFLNLIFIRGRICDRFLKREIKLIVLCFFLLFGSSMLSMNQKQMIIRLKKFETILKTAVE